MERVKDNIIDNLAYCTVYIVNSLDAYGTGFLYKDNNNKKWIITNKHNIKDAEGLKVVYRKEEHTQLEVQAISLDILNKHVIRGTTVDLCMIPILEGYFKGIENKHCFLTQECIATKEDLNELHTLDNIAVASYIGDIKDIRYYAPVIMQGTVSFRPLWGFTPCKEASNADDNFLINVTCYHGSSGSPVFHVEKKYTVVDQQVVVEDEVKLVGILTEMLNFASNDENGFLKEVPTNLGRVIKSYKILDLSKCTNSFKVDKLN